VALVGLRGGGYAGERYVGLIMRMGMGKQAKTAGRKSHGYTNTTNGLKLADPLTHNDRDDRFSSLY